MKVRVDYLKLEASTQFGAFTNRTFGSIEEARDWVQSHVPKSDLDLIRVKINGQSVSGPTLQAILKPSE